MSIPFKYVLCSSMASFWLQSRKALSCWSCEEETRDWPAWTLYQEKRSPCIYCFDSMVTSSRWMEQHHISHPATREQRLLLFLLCFYWQFLHRVMLSEYRLFQGCFVHFVPGGVPVWAERELPVAWSITPQSQHGQKLRSLQTAWLWAPCWSLWQVKASEYKLNSHTSLIPV